MPLNDGVAEGELTDVVNKTSAGVETGTSGSPFRVDPTGTTTQPVSGTVTANAGTNLNTSLLALDATLTNRTQKTQITNGTNEAAVLNAEPVGSNYGLVVRNIPRERLTYAAATPSTVPAATATDIFTITGSGTKTVYIHKITVTGTRTAHAHDLVQLIKRSTANTAGTSSTLTNVPYDSGNAAATAVVRSYTANPTLGTAVGTLYARRVSFPVQTPSNAQGNGGSVKPWVWEAGRDGQAIVLRGTAQVLAVNLNAVTIAGGILQFSIEWSEE